MQIVFNEVDVKRYKLNCLLAQIKVKHGVTQREIQELTFPNVHLRYLTFAVHQHRQVKTRMFLNIQYAFVMAYTFRRHFPYAIVHCALGQRTYLLQTTTLNVDEHFKDAGVGQMLCSYVLGIFKSS